MHDVFAVIQVRWETINLSLHGSTYSISDNHPKKNHKIDK